MIELEGEELSKTIQEYSTYNFIRNYANKLPKLHYPEQKDLIMIVVDNLLSWYEEEIT